MLLLTPRTRPSSWSLQPPSIGRHALAVCAWACGASAVLAQSAVPIDTSQSSVSLRGSTVVIQRLAVPGLGTYDAEFTWDGVGNFRLSAATPSAATGGGASGGVLRTCRLDFGLADVEIAVKADVLDVTITSKSNEFLFVPTTNTIRQGTNSSEIGYGGVDFAKGRGYRFYWTGQEGFEVGLIPTGAVKRGTISKLDNNTWFNFTAPFVLTPVGGPSLNC